MLEEPQNAPPFTRYLARVSRLTRGVGITISGCALIGALASLGVSYASDRLGFMLVSVGFLCLGVIVWSVGVFHGAAAHAFATLRSLDARVYELARRGASGAPRTASAAPPAPVAEVVTEPAAVAATAAEPDGLAPSPAAPHAVEASVPEASTASSGDAPREVAPARGGDQDVARVPCRRCGGLIHPDARRCVHCMKKVA
ncbi:MAG: hypothetical protein OZ921_00820 [Sorangiineae bacterium]|nr:hypothetical protein [Polyangiaceae bacterium]MEB2321025.1 hypothetical protein [Sorangiineae bacterium]